ncbi:MAG: hypothetical protein F4226_03395 [Synechococcus sp. SB0678_bin_12]|nr:hypothetical protein [Gammaproteobacteria bacterium]MYF35853.1 hypothetical protein [Synechococcus sp. SB0678_bin_12]
MSTLQSSVPKLPNLNFSLIPDRDFNYTTFELVLELNERDNDKSWTNRKVIAFARNNDQISKLMRKRGTGYFWYKLWKIWFFLIRSPNTTIPQGKVIYEPFELESLRRKINTMYHDSYLSRESKNELLKYLDNIINCL